MPLSLVGLALIVMWYADLYPLNQFLYMGVIDIFVIIVLTTFFTRIQRLLIYFFVPVISFAFAIVIDTLQISFNFLINIVGIGSFLFPFLNVGFFLGNLSLILIYGNNLTVKITKKAIPTSSAIAWGIYGFSLDILYLYMFPQSGTEVSPFLFEGFYKFIRVPPLAPLFAIILAIIGFTVGKYTQRRASK